MSPVIYRLFVEETDSGKVLVETTFARMKDAVGLIENRLSDYRGTVTIKITREGGME